MLAQKIDSEPSGLGYNIESAGMSASLPASGQYSVDILLVCGWSGSSRRMTSAWSVRNGRAKA